MFQITIWITIIIVIIGGVVFILPWGLMYIMNLFDSLRDSTPEIIYGEFPFRIEYELDGEIHVIEDIVIVEFDGFVFSTRAMSRERKWVSRLASGKTEILFEGNLIIRFFPGSAGYYMGEFSGIDILSIPHVVFIHPNGDPITDVRARLVLEESSELFKEYGITLISWEISEPIVRYFGD